jgi:U6 snRNA-associated Sm-like protein LSm8
LCDVKKLPVVYSETMSSARSLEDFVDSKSLTLQTTRANTRAEKVVVITVDGRTLVGKLLTHDQVTNIVLGDTIERIIRPADDPEQSSETSHGLYLVRGDNITMLGLVEEELDASIDWTKVRGEVIGSTKHV